MKVQQFRESRFINELINLELLLFFSFYRTSVEQITHLAKKEVNKSMIIITLIVVISPNPVVDVVNREEAIKLNMPNVKR